MFSSNIFSDSFSLYSSIILYVDIMFNAAQTSLILSTFKFSIIFPLSLFQQLWFYAFYFVP